MNLTTEDFDRFWAHVEVPEFDDCWLWCGLDPERSRAYAVFYAHGAYHRGTHIALMLAIGQSVPDGMMVRHLCHTPACVRPAHLSIGTAQDNSDDSKRVGRFANRRTPAWVVSPRVALALRAKARERGRTFTSVMSEAGEMWLNAEEPRKRPKRAA